MTHKRVIPQRETETPTGSAAKPTAQPAAAFWPERFAVLLFLLVAFAAMSVVTAAETVEPLHAALLTQDLGDPRYPANVKMVLNLPLHRLGPNTEVKPEDFRVFVYPKGMKPAEGKQERYRAGGLYVWRNGYKVFVDARAVPPQEADGPATIRVVYAPGGTPLAEGEAEGSSRYAAELVDVVLVVDISLSMLHNDPNKVRVAAARSFIETARQSGGIGRIGLVTFNHKASLDTPLLPLSEGEKLLKILDGIGADGMTDLDKPLETAMKELGGSNRPVIVFLTDGKNEGSDYLNTHLEAARRGVRIFAVGLSEHTDHDLLREMAESTDGMYFKAAKDADLPDIYARLAAELGKRQLLRAQILDASGGVARFPVDGTVRRLSALVDGGARVGMNGPGKGMDSESKATNVHQGNPNPGEWEFTWERATPGLSILALSADTQFFLDVFPPQLRSGRFAVAATLAEGYSPLGGARVWVEPVAGVLPDGLQLYDDGRHGDGGAGDGVYGADLELPDAPEQFDLTVRASGQAWEQGEFIRQTSALAIKSREPPPGWAGIADDLDFGVLFPGESGTAFADIALDARSAQKLSLDLTWHDAGIGLQELSSSLLFNPGRRSLELEITVPETARPGNYQGAFSISDGLEMGDKVAARVRVGTVRFYGGETVDLGQVPPGTFTSHILKIPYYADKAAPLSAAVTGNENLRMANPPGEVAPGSGSLDLEVTASAPLNQAEGEYGGTLRLRAGPGAVEIPLRWRVKAYAAEPEELAPVQGVPKPPELGVTHAPLKDALEPDRDLWQAEPELPADRVDSPFDKTAEMFQDTPSVSGVPTAPADFVLPDPGKTKKGSSFWSAWWIYILAALLLLLLLLLILAYILYRLGKSALARFLLASAIANILLLIAFLLMLGAAPTDFARAEQSITVSLTEPDPEASGVIDFSPAEQEMLTAASSSPSAAGGGGESGLPGELSFADAGAEAASAASSSSGGALVSERQLDIPDSAPNENIRLTQDSLQPSAMSYQNELSDQQNLRRRERLPERNQRFEPAPDEREFPELLEMAEPASAPAPSENLAENAAEQQVDEARPDLAEKTESARAKWSEGERPRENLSQEQGLLLAEATGVEKVSMDPTVRRVDPLGRRRAPRETPDTQPEPRVEIADPIRDAENVASAEPKLSAEGRPGVEELRPEARAVGADYVGAKQGVVMPEAASYLNAPKSDSQPRGESGTDLPELALVRGAQRDSRGGAPRAARSLPNRQGGIPGGTGASLSGSVASDATGQAESRSPGASSGGGHAKEKRFDSEPSGGGAGGPEGQRDGTGKARTTLLGDGGEGSGAAPNPFGEGGGSERADFARAGQGGTGLEAGPRGGQRRGDRQGSGEKTGSGSGSGEPGGKVPGLMAGNGNGNGSGGAPGMGSRSGPGGSGSGLTGSGPGGGGGGNGGVGNGGGSGGGGNGNGSGSGSGGSGRGSGRGVGEGRFDDLAGGFGGTGFGRRQGDGGQGLGQSVLGGGDGQFGLGVVSLPVADSDWKRMERRDRKRVVGVAASAVDMDSLLLVLGDFSGMADDAAGELFGKLKARLPKGLTVESRRVKPEDGSLSDTLLALLTPEEMAGWGDAALQRVAAYLKSGGHIWLDAPDRDEVLRQLERLSKAAGGVVEPLAASHQLAEGEKADALQIGGKLAAVATYQDWRREGSVTRDSRRPLRFLSRTLNYFLSGNADEGIVLEPEKQRGGATAEPVRDVIPDRLAGDPARAGTVWDEFGPETAAQWRMPSWSDPGRISAISDGQGGRALKMDLQAAVKGRAAVYRTLAPTQDFARTRRITLEAYYDGAGTAALSLVFTVQGQKGWIDYETPSQVLENGWNRLEFDLTGRDFRLLSPGGGPGRELTGADRTGRAGFFLYRDGKAPATSLIRNFRLW